MFDICENENGNSKSTIVRSITQKQNLSISLFPQYKYLNIVLLIEKNNKVEIMDKLSALSYLTKSKPICDNCLRGNLEQVRMAAGLYQLVKDIIADDQETFNQAELDLKITLSTTF